MQALQQGGVNLHDSVMNCCDCCLLPSMCMRYLRALDSARKVCMPWIEHKMLKCVPLYYLARRMSKQGYIHVDSMLLLTIIA